MIDIRKRGNFILFFLAMVLLWSVDWKAAIGGLLLVLAIYLDYCQDK